MSVDTLYIIGNGFDCSHNLPTRYTDFFEYCQECELFYEDSFLADLNEIFPELNENERNWCNFEAQLSNFSIDSTIESQIKEAYESLGLDHDDYQSFLNNINVEEYINIETYQNTIKTLRSYFKEWIKSINIKSTTPIYQFNKNAVFLNFNYTRTIEELYNVNEEKICYIHGRVGDEDLVIGHSWEYKVKINDNEDRFIQTSDNKILDTQENEVLDKSEFEEKYNLYETTECEKKIFSIFRSKIILPLQKQSIDIIENTSFFDELEELDIKNVFVLGHSLSNVDMPYFEELIRRLQNPTWFITCFNNNDLERIDFFNSKFNLGDSCKVIKFSDLV